MKVPDTQLRQDVVDELEFQPSIDAANIGVAVDSGVVTLTGHVSSYAEKFTAEEAVRRVKGVRAVAEELKVRFPGGPKTSDDQIAKQALNALQWDITVPHEKITLTVERGLITLRGQVQWEYQKTAAENAVRRLAGVTGVINGLTIEPKAQAADVQEKIEAALKRRAEIEAKAIRVSVSKDKVSLYGDVDNWDELRAVKNAAWSAPGVRIVEDHLTISA
jgi:osmotically-inducible protein OsmY